MITDWLVCDGEPATTHGRLLLRPIDPHKDAALYRPDNADDGMGGLGVAQLCEIVLMSPEAAMRGAYSIGQKVFVAKYKGASLEIEGEELLIIDVSTDLLLVKGAE